MKYNYLGKTELKVSELCLGTMTFGRETDEQTAIAMVDRFEEVGGNFIDSADAYGSKPGLSEEIVGKALKRRRQDFILATKVNFPTGPGPNDRGLSRTHIMQAIDASLKRLQTDYIDIYFIHCWNSITPLEDSLFTLDNLVKSGKVRYLGASNFAAWKLMKALGISDRFGWQRFVCFQLQYSLVIRHIEPEFFPLCQEEGLGIVTWSPLGGGFLSGKYTKSKQPPSQGRIAGVEKREEYREKSEDSWQKRATEQNFRILEEIGKIAKKHGKSYAQIALSWIRAKPEITAPIIGARTMAQLEDNLGCIEWELTEEEVECLDKVSSIEEPYPYRFISKFGW
ncbi:MAG: aldo/keto reductase [Candidatus Marinimicrobia bacterium]|nr:aldo/keto reductase [Candidatus Neomarinimicrobiota bacterium]